MFEDFKEKIRENQKIEGENVDLGLSPEILAKLKEQGINPENFTLEQLFPPVKMMMALTCRLCLLQKWI